MCIPDDFIIAPLTVEIVESTDLAGMKLRDYRHKNIERWKQVNREERNKIISQMYRETALEIKK